jgi:hypothetical protein
MTAPSQRGETSEKSTCLWGRSTYGLSHLNYEVLTQLKRERNCQRWLGVVARWRKS